MEPRGSHAPDLIDAMSPPGYPWARLLSSMAGFRFARPDQFNARGKESPGEARGVTKSGDFWGPDPHPFHGLPARFVPPFND